MKPRISYADLAWMKAFAAIQKLAEERAVFCDFKIIHINDDPPWVQVKSKAGNRMVRKGDEFIHALLKQ